MGERLIFHSSVGFCIAAAYLLYKGMEKIKPAMTGRVALGGLMVLLAVLCGFKTIERNENWKNDETLFNHDIVEAPNSILVNSNVASSLINKAEVEKDSLKKREDLHMGIQYYNKALELHNTFVSGYMNRFVAYLKLNEPDSAKTNLDLVRMYYPKYPKMEEIYYNLGVCYYMKQEIPKAIAMWQISLKLNPAYGIAQQSINTATQAMQAQQRGEAVNVK
jgi:tetratricopeptide (TPR) repeat protein